MISISSIQLYDLLITKIGEAEAKTFIEFIEVKVKDTFAHDKSNLATKEEMCRLETKISESKAEIMIWMIVMFAPFYVEMFVFLLKQFMFY